MDVDQVPEQIRQAPLRLLSARIKRARSDAGFTLDQLAEKVGTSRQHLIRLERGEHRPRADMLKRLALATGQPLEFFFSERSAVTDQFASLGDSLADVLRREVRAIIRDEMSTAAEAVA